MADCEHENVRGPRFFRDPVACEDCGEPVPCPHPESARERPRYIGTPKPRQSLCLWCGEKFDPEPEDD